MRIYKRGDTWWAQWRGERFSLKTTDKTAAELAFREHQRRDADPTYRAPHEATRLSAELVEFIAAQKTKGRTPETLRAYGFHARHFARVFGAKTTLPQIDATAIDRFLATRSAEGAARNTQWAELCTLRGCLKRARRQGRYPFSLDQVMPEGFAPPPEPGSRHLLLPGVWALVAALPAERAAVVRFIVGTAADWRSVELAEAGDIAGGYVTVRGTKTAHRRRVVPVLPIFAPILDGVSPPFEPWGNVRRDLEVACRHANVTRVTPRDLRRSHSRILRAAGVEPALIAPMMGHRDGRMVERIYGRIEPAELGAAISARLSAAPGGSAAAPARKGSRLPKPPPLKAARAPRAKA